MILDAVIPVSRKDFIKLPFVIDALCRNQSIGTVYVISPEPIDGPASDILRGRHGITALLDSDVLPFSKNIFRHRPGWVYQQFIKLLQNVTDTDWYLSVDADLFVLKPLPFFANGKANLFYARDWQKIIAPYGRFTEGMLGIQWNEFSLMNDIALYNKDVVRSMTDYAGGYDNFVSRAASL